MTKEMWKQGRPFTIALLYSAIFLLRIAGAASFLAAIASLGQMVKHRPHPAHWLISISALPSCQTGVRRGRRL